MAKKLSIREDAIRKKHSTFLKDILTYRDSFIRYHKSKRMECTRISRASKLWLDSEEARKEKMENRAEQRRLQALRDQDMVAYNQLVMETKNVRLKYLLSQTEGYIQTIHKMIEEQRGANAPPAVPQEGDQSGGAAVVPAPPSSGAQLAGAGGTMSQKYFESTHRLTEQVVQPHILKGGDLKEYQLAGLQWLVSLHNNNLNGILADEMGLGKTIQAISLLAYITEFKNNHGPFLVVVPLSTLSNWVNEFTKWVPEMTRVVYKGAPPTRKSLYKEVIEPGHFNVLITTYEYIMKDKAWLKKTQWEYIIVDEGHRMKNAQSKFAQILGSQYTSKHRILLTGTPLQNNLPELWSLLNFLLPSIFNSVDTFDQWFNKPFASFRQSQASTGASSEDGDVISLTQEERLLIVQRLHEVLRPFMLRRVKSQVLDQLPAKTEMVLRCELSGWQRKLYQTVQQRCARSIKALLKQGDETDAVVQRSTSSGSLNDLGNNDLEGMEGDPEDSNAGATSASIGAEALQLASASSTGLNNVIMQLRKICNHPYLFMSDWNIDDDLIRSSGKFELLDRMLPKLKAAGHRVLMFSQMTQLMTILERFFELRGFTYLRLDGSTQSDEREKRMYEFNDPNSPYFIFLLSTRAGGLGLNLATADTVFLFDSDWNPMMDAQAQGRAHRIGQKNAVRVFRLITTSPVEERILARATEKLNLTELVVEAGKFNKNSSHNDFDDRKELVEALLMEYSESREVDEEGGGAGESVIPDEDQLNEMMALHESEVALYQRMDAALAERRSKEWAESALGKSGVPIPPRLMTADQLPAWIESGACWHPKYGKLFIPQTLQEVPPPEFDSDGNVISARKRKWDGVAVYNENMTDAEFDVFIGERAGGRSAGTSASRGGGTAKRGRGAGGRAAVSADAPPAAPKVPRAPGSWLRGRRPARGRGRAAAARGRGSGSGRGGGRGVRVMPGVIPMGITQALIRIMLALRKIPRIDGSMLSTLFLDLPDAKHYPDYYAIVKNPVSLKTMTRKLRDAKYNSTSELTSEMNTMVQNALLYNGSDSPVYKDALLIQERYLQQVFALGISIDASGKEQSSVALDETGGGVGDGPEDEVDDGEVAGQHGGEEGDEDDEGGEDQGMEGEEEGGDPAQGAVSMDVVVGEDEEEQLSPNAPSAGAASATPAAKRVRLSMPS
jgi:superfamily II DNA or RNA helicase